MTSDFFLEEADAWERKHLGYHSVSKRCKVLYSYKTQKESNHLPSDWEDGYDNVILNVTCENQRRADERIPILLSIPAKHKGIMCAPFIGHINIEPYLNTNQIELVICGGENYDVHVHFTMNGSKIYTIPASDTASLSTS